MAVTDPRYHGRAAFDPAILARVEALLARDWDADGAIVRAAADAAPMDGARPRSLAAYAAAVCGILAAGGSEAEVMGYLRREEEYLVDQPRTEGTERAAIAGAAWRLVRGIPRAEDLAGLPPVT
jgi:hypothetical protein